MSMCILARIDPDVDLEPAEIFGDGFRSWIVSVRHERTIFLSPGAVRIFSKRAPAEAMFLCERDHTGELRMLVASELRGGPPDLFFFSGRSRP